MLAKHKLSSGFISSLIISAGHDLVEGDFARMSVGGGNEKHHEQDRRNLVPQRARGSDVAVAWTLSMPQLSAPVSGRLRSFLGYAASAARRASRRRNSDQGRLTAAAEQA